MEIIRRTTPKVAEVRAELKNNGISVKRCRLINGRLFVTVLEGDKKATEKVLFKLNIDHSLMRSVYSETSFGRTDFPSLMGY